MRSLLVFALFGCWSAIAIPASAAGRKAIDAAIKNGAEFLDGRFKNQKPGGNEASEGIGPAALAGLALMESGKPTTDASIKAIAAAVRDASYSETRTYQLSLCLLFLDRLGDPSDGPRIQMLAVRLLAGQNRDGGWTYACIGEVPKVEEQRLRAKLEDHQLETGEKGAKPSPMPSAKNAPGTLGVAGRLHPEIEKHRQGLLANQRGDGRMHDDNSNTQFAILAVWVARNHGVPVEAALDAIEKRFLASQTPSGGWPYSGILAADGSPSMTCAGLLGLATALGRREERRLKAEAPKRPEPAPKAPEPKTSPEDPFFTPPPKPAPEPKKPAHSPKFNPDLKDKAIEGGLDNLAAVLRGEAVARGRNPFKGPGRLGDKDMYFLWSLERVGVVYGLEKIGKLDWYQLGADILIPAQNRDGSWGGGHGAEVDTAFAILFLAKSNLVRDLSAKVQRDPRNNELRGGPNPGAESGASSAAMPESRRKADPVAVLPKPEPALPVPIVEPSKPRPLPVEDESAKLAEALLKVPPAAWAKSLEQVRDGKGGDFTRALVIAVHKVEGDRKKDVRHAIAERLTRMSAETLRAMLKSDDVEVRRAATLACGMKDDKAHVPDLIDRLADDEEIVIRAARAGLKSLSGGQDFGPDAGSTKLDRQIAVEEWKAWWAKQKR